MDRGLGVDFEFQGTSEATSAFGDDARFFEPVPAGLTAGVSCERLRKTFPPAVDSAPAVKAVDGLDLSVYTGQITAVLGHNGEWHNKLPDAEFTSGKLRFFAWIFADFSHDFFLAES